MSHTVPSEKPDRPHLMASTVVGVWPGVIGTSLKIIARVTPASPTKAGGMGSRTKAATTVANRAK